MKYIPYYRTMKRNFVFVCIAVGALLMSCQTAPRVSADLTAHLPARSADSVMIFKTTEAVPASAQVIGTVKVKDGGLLCHVAEEA